MGVIARQSIKGAIANYLGVAIGFYVSFFVLTRYLTQEEIGLTRVLIDAAVLFSSLAMMGSGQSLVKFFPYFRDGRTHHGIFGLATLLSLAGFALFAVVFLLFQGPLLEAYSRKAPLLADYFHLVPMITFFALYVGVYEAGASVLMRVSVPKMVREVGVRLFNLVAYLLYGWGWVSLDVFVWLFCGSYGLAMLLNLFYLVKVGGAGFRVFRVDWSFLGGGQWGAMLRYSLLMAATVLAGNIPLMNSLFIGAKVGLALTGVYTIAAFVANVVEVPYRSLGAISRPVVAAAVKEGRWGDVERLGREVSLHQLLVSGMVFVLIWINVDALFAVIPNGADYAGGAWVVFILGLAKVMNSSLSIGTDILGLSNRYSRSLFFVAVLTGGAVVFNGLLIPRMGIEGAALATLCAYGVYFVLLLLYLRVRLGVSLFSRGQLKVVVVMGGLQLLDVGWKWVVGGGGEMSVGGVLLWAGVKTVVFLLLGLGGVYGWRVSPTVNGLVKKCFRVQ